MMKNDWYELKNGDKCLTLSVPSYQNRRVYGDEIPLPDRDFCVERALKNWDSARCWMALAGCDKYGDKR